MRFAAFPAFIKAYEELVGGTLRTPFGFEVKVCATYDASDYFGARREKARRMAETRSRRKQLREERVAARKPKTPPKAASTRRPPAPKERKKKRGSVSRAPNAR